MEGGVALFKLKGRFAIYSVLLILAILALFVSCDPLGDYLIEITGATYYEGYIVVSLTPAYTGLRVENFSLLNDKDDEEYAIIDMKYEKDGHFISYFLTLDEDVVLEPGKYLVLIEKRGFQFIYRDILKDGNQAIINVLKSED